MLPHLQLLSLPAVDYTQLPVSAADLKLDFDDVYQYRLAKAYNLALVKLDRDFRFVSDIQVQFNPHRRPRHEVLLYLLCGVLLLAGKVQAATNCATVMDSPFR
jgi:hypothetical protein